MYSVGTPIGVQVASADQILANSNLPIKDALVYIKDGNYITFNNLTISGANSASIGIWASTNITIDHCTISNSGMEGIIITGGTTNNFTITNNSFSNINNNVIKGGESTYWIIENNNVTNCAMIPGM